MSRRWLALLVALLLVVPAGATLAQQDRNETDEDDDRDDDRDDEAEDADRDDDEREGDEVERKVEVSRSDSEVVFELEKETDADEEKVKIEFSSEDDPEVKLEFEREAGDDGNESESTFEYKVEFMRLVEYQDNDGDDVLSDADNVTSEVDLGDADWSIGQVQDISAGGEDGKKVTVTADLGDNGTFEVVMYVFGDFAKVNATSLRPTDVKLDFVVDSYPWQADDTRLALDLKTEVKSEREVESGGNDTSLNVTAEDISGYFTWADNATVDGQSTPVTSDVYEDETKSETEQETDEDGTEAEAEVEREQKLTLNYEQGDRIVHDPVLGVQYQSAAQQFNSLPFPAFAGVMVAIGVALWVGRRD